MDTQIYEGFTRFLKNEKGLSASSVKAYVETILYIYRYGDPLSLTKYKDVAALICKIKEERRWSDRTTYKTASMLAVFLNWAFRDGLILDSPMRLGHSFKKCETKQVEFFDWESAEFKRVMNNPNLTVRLKAILHTLRASGIRNSELCDLHREDWNDRWLRIRKGKGGRERFAPVDETCMNWLKIYLDDLKNFYSGEWLFTTETFQKLRPHILWKQLYNLGRKIGVHLYPHKFRHSLAGKLISNGADITLAASVLGHSSLSSTKMYTHFSKKQTLDQYDKFSA